MTNPEIQNLSPRSIYRANVAMNCAYALFMDQLYSGATDYSTSYTSTNEYEAGLKLLRAWQEVKDSLKPGDEYHLVDEFARVLRLQSWFEWRTMAEDTEKPQGPTNEQLLKQKHSAAVMYCVDALRRFDGMEPEQVFRVASEVAVLGVDGIDYTSSEPLYTLDSIPGEAFSGLHLLCLMYVGFKITDPTIDTRLDFEDAYNLAKKLHGQ